MIVSAHCPTTATSSEEGCIPSSYILYGVIIVVFVLLIVGALAYRQHARQECAQAERCHDLEAQGGTSRPDLVRTDSAKTETSPAPSYHTVDQRQKAMEADIAIMPEIKRPSPVLSPATAWVTAEEQPAVNFSRRTLLSHQTASAT